jgi:hypothetical protein
MKKSRDDFTEKTRLQIAKRAGWLCSYPPCRTPTVGATSDGQGEINIGTAAHICAAAPGGPRYDPNMSPANARPPATASGCAGTMARLSTLPIQGLPSRGCANGRGRRHRIRGDESCATKLRAVQQFSATHSWRLAFGPPLKRIFLSFVARRDGRQARSR